MCEEECVVGKYKKVDRALNFIIIILCTVILAFFSVSCNRCIYMEYYYDYSPCDISEPCNDTSEILDSHIS